MSAPQKSTLDSDRSARGMAKPKRQPPRRGSVKGITSSADDREARAEDLLRIARAAEPAGSSPPEGQWLRKTDFNNIKRHLEVIRAVASSCIELLSLNADQDNRAMVMPLQRVAAAELLRQAEGLDKILHGIRRKTTGGCDLKEGRP
jgi:hypothetical protein